MQGLTNVPKKEWERFTERDLRKSPIERLTPHSDLHDKVRDYLLERLNSSERKMRTFYARWRVNEMKLQSYIMLDDWEERLKQMNDTGRAPKAVNIVVPYSYAVVSTVVTYLLQSFAGRKPILQAAAYDPALAQVATAMEDMLQYQADRMRLVNVLWQFLQDSQIYNLGVMKCYWQKQQAYRTTTMSDPLLGTGTTRSLRTIYAGNRVENVDPFLFFPDPNVPMSKVAHEGEYVFWRSFVGQHALLKGQSQGKYRYVDAAGQMPRGGSYGESARSILASGDSIAGEGSGHDQRTIRYHQIDECSIEIIPKELNLGPETSPEKWIFTIANKRQIIRAQPFGYDHDMHPVAVTEPYGTGYGFGHAGLVDMISPLQDVMSWLVNSHIENVRSVMNNMFLVDPSKVEMKDILRPEPAKVIRLKRSAFSSDIRHAIQQLPVQDVTSGHSRDLQQFMSLADSLTGVSDNLRGLQSDGGRKTATEVRTSIEAGASRLAATARVISSQALVCLAEQMTLNTQQQLTPSQWKRVLGERGLEAAEMLSSPDFAGDFNFPVNDGTLPMDKVALLDVWREMFMNMSQDPQLAGAYDRAKIFEWIAELGGAKNISQFRMQVMPDQQIDTQVQAGNLVPTSATPGTSSNPAGRLAGGMTL